MFSGVDGTRNGRYALRMTPEDVITHYGSQAAAARALGIPNRCTVWQWVRRGQVPWLRQCEIQIKTRGRLKAERP